MAVISKLLYDDGKRVTKYNNSIISNLNFNGTDYHFAKKKQTNSICENAVEEPLVSMKISGNSVQEEQPTLNMPVEIQSVGDYDETTGKYKIPLKIIGGKNLFIPTPWKTLVVNEGGINFQYLEDEDCFLLNGKAIKTATYVQRYLPYAIPVAEGMRYSLRSTYVSGSISGTLAVGYFGAGNTPTSYNNWMNVALSNKTTTSGATCIYKYINRFWFYIEKDVTFVNYKVKIQLELNKTSTEHQKYMKILNLYLDDPLRKIGDYADYLDYKNKKIIRKVKSEFLTNVNAKSANSDTYSIFLSDISNKPKMQTEVFGLAMSNKFAQLAGNSYTELKDKGGYVCSYVTSSGLNKIAYSFNDTSITTLEQAQETIGDGFEVYYILDTPIKESINIPGDVPELKTDKGRNEFSVETLINPSDFKLNYWEQIGIDEINSYEDITQINSNILVIKTGANITQNGSNLLIGE